MRSDSHQPRSSPQEDTTPPGWEVLYAWSARRLRHRPNRGIRLDAYGKDDNRAVRQKSLPAVAHVQFHLELLLLVTISPISWKSSPNFPTVRVQ